MKFTRNNNCLNVTVHGWLRFPQIYILFIFQHFECYTTLIVKEHMVYKYMCGRCNCSYYDEADRHVKVRFREHIGISPLKFGKVKPSKESAIRDHLIWNNIPSFDEFTSWHMTSLPSWHMDIINKFLKSKKACLLSMIDLP